MAKRLGSNRSTPPQPNPGEGHNSGMAPEERAKAEAANKQLRYLSGIQALRAVAPKVAAKRAELKELTDSEKAIFLDLKKDGHDTKDVKADLVDVGAVRRNVDAKELARAERRAWLGLPVGRSDEQLELESRLPEVEKGAIEFRASGYTAGVTGQVGQPPADVAQAGFIAEWSQGWKDGQAILIMAMGKKSPKPKVEPKPEPTPEEERKAEREATARAKASLEAMKPIEEGSITLADVAAAVADVFEETKAQIDASGEALRPKDADDAFDATAEAEGVE